MIVSIIPYPPEVPGKNALMKLLDCYKTWFIIMGLPEISTVIKGIYFSLPLINEIMLFSKSLKFI